MSDEGQYYIVPGYYYPIWYVTKTSASNVEIDDFGDGMTPEQFHKDYPEARKMKADNLQPALRRMAMIREEEDKQQ